MHFPCVCKTPRQLQSCLLLRKAPVSFCKLHNISLSFRILTAGAIKGHKICQRNPGGDGRGALWWQSFVCSSRVTSGGCLVLARSPGGLLALRGAELWYQFFAHELQI